MAALYHSYILPWTFISEEVKRLKKFTIVALAIGVILGLIIPFIPVPKDKAVVDKVPERYAQLVMEQKKKPPPPPPPKPKPKPKPKKEPEKKKPEKKKPEKPKPKPKPKPPEKTRAEIVEEARKKAASKFAATFDDLSDLRDTKVALNQPKKLSQGGGEQKKSFTRSVLTSGEVVSGSGGINTSNLSTGIGRSELAGRSTTKVESDIEKIAKAGGTLQKGAGKSPSRTVEDVKIVMDRNKGRIYSIYNRFLRKDPTLEGKVVFELTIDPSGSVVNIKIISSDLNSPELEDKLMKRIKLFNFGAKDVGQTIVEFPIDFLPS